MHLCDTQAPARPCSMDAQAGTGVWGSLSLWAAAEGAHEATGEGEPSGLTKAQRAG